MNLVNFIRLAGLAHLGLMVAGATMVRVTDFRAHAAALPLFLGQLFRVYLGFIGGLLMALALACLFLAPELADGTRLARSVCGAIAAVHVARLGVQFAVFDVRAYLRNGWLRLGYHVTTVTFTFLASLFVALAAGWIGGGKAV
jgi:hypothetical protein